MMREALAGYLVAQPGVASVDTAADADGALRLARRGCDVLVLDLKLADGESGLEVLEALQNLGIATPVLVLNGRNDLDLTAHALSLGALGYCPKTASPSELYGAIVDVAAGHASIPDDVLQPLLHSLLVENQAVAESSSVLATLTEREKDVLRLLVLGVQRMEIARRLGLSGNTVRTHLRHLMQKLGVSTQLAAAARGRKLLDVTWGADRSDAPSGVVDLTEREPRQTCS
jgi:DNA-binding NarL/FixJ family response regulator